MGKRRKPIDRERLVIAESRLSSLIALACVPAVLMAVMTIGLSSGWGTSQGMSHRTLGPLACLLFYGGMLYATYEFMDTLFRRRHYISIIGNHLCVVHHPPVRISSITDIHVEYGFIIRSLVICRHNERRIRIKAHFLKESPQVVLERLEAATRDLRR
jgi:hypothetical protein